MKIISRILIVFALTVILAAPTLPSSLLNAAQKKGEKTKKKKGKKRVRGEGKIIT